MSSFLINLHLSDLGRLNTIYAHVSILNKDLHSINHAIVNIRLTYPASVPPKFAQR